MSAQIIHLSTAIHKPASRVCWPCVAMWCAMPLLWVAVFAWVLS